VSSETREMYGRDGGVDPQGLRGPLGFIAMAILCAVASGLLVITTTVLAVDALRASSGADNLDVTFSLLVIGTLSGILVASFSTWRLLAPLESTYRRGGFSIVAGFATVLLMLICIPVNQLFGRPGLVLLLISFGVAAWALSRTLRRRGVAR
jgi:hypothetical protein